VIQTIQAGVPVARIEVANAMQMDAINKYSKLDPPVAPTLKPSLSSLLPGGVTAVA
jgi:D-lactate dehydrogenase (cytochrome)